MEAIAERKKKMFASSPPFIYEIIDEQPYYYKGYRDVLEGVKKLEDIVGSSSLQAAIIGYLLRLLIKADMDTKYWVFSNEIGLHIDKANNLAGDLMIFDKEGFPGLSDKYPAVPPIVHIEVDISADLADEEQIDYIRKKTAKSLSFGTQKLIWIFSTNESVLVAEPHGAWKWYNWNVEIELIENLRFNIAQFLHSVGYSSPDK